MMVHACNLSAEEADVLAFREGNCIPTDVTEECTVIDLYDGVRATTGLCLKFAAEKTD